MRGKLWFLGGAAVGFVIGARAGRERYDQLTRAARNLWDHPTTQEATGVVQEQASRLYSRGKETVGGKLGQTRLGEKLSRQQPGRAEPGHEPGPNQPGPHEPGGRAAGWPETDPLTGATDRDSQGTTF